MELVTCTSISIYILLLLLLFLVFPLRIYVCMCVSRQSKYAQKKENASLKSRQRQTETNHAHVYIQDLGVHFVINKEAIYVVNVSSSTRTSQLEQRFSAYQRFVLVYYFYKVLVHHDISIISNATSLQKKYFEICAFFSWVSVQICGMCTYKKTYINPTWISVCWHLRLKAAILYQVVSRSVHIRVFQYGHFLISCGDYKNDLDSDGRFQVFSSHQLATCLWDGMDTAR